MTKLNNTLDYSQITDYLYIGVTPKNDDYPLLREIGVRLIINMRAETLFRKPPILEDITEFRVPTFDSRLFPIRHTALIAPLDATTETIGNGGSVYVFCRQGRHRSIAMGAAILISQGASLDDSIRLIEERRPAADAEAVHIRKAIVEFDDYNKNK